MPAPPVHPIEHRVESISDYIKLVERSDRIDPEHPALFRGQRKDWPLLPGIARFVAQDYSQALARSSSPVRVAAEAWMINELKRQGPQFTEFQMDSAWDWLSLAQHYFMPTRLLDWSANSLAALWFAVCKPVLAEDMVGPNAHGVVWIYTPAAEDFLLDDRSVPDPFAIQRLLVVKPRHITRRVIAQLGYFTAHPHLSNGEFAQLEKDSLQVAKLTKIKIPYTSFYGIRRALNFMGINHFSVFPDLSGLCQHIAWARSLDPDSVRPLRHYNVD